MSEFSTELRAEDARLLQIAARPAARLFPVFDRAMAMGPLVLVLVVAPALFAVQFWDPANSGAGSILEAARIADSDSPAARFAMFREGIEAGPLGGWALLAVVVSLFGLGFWSLVLPGLIAHAVLLASVYALMKQLRGARFALWGVLLLAFHPLLLARLQTFDPYVLGDPLAIAAMAVIFAATNSRKGRLPLAFFAGLLLGLAALFGCGFAVCFVPLGIAVLAGASREKWTRFSENWQTTGLFLSAAMIGGGWWLISSGSFHLWESVAGTKGAAFELAALGELLWALQPLVLLATVAAVSHPRTTDDRRARQFFSFWLVGLLTATVITAIAAGGDPLASLLGNLVHLLVPAAVLSAMTIEEICERRIPNRPAALIIGLTLLLWVVLTPAVARIPWITWGLGLLAPFVLACCAAMLATRKPTARVPLRPRYALTAGLCAILGASLVIGMTTIRSAGHDTSASYWEIRDTLGPVTRPHTVVIVSEYENTVVPAELAAVSLWRDAKIHRAEMWDSRLLRTEWQSPSGMLIILWRPIDADPSFRTVLTVLGYQFERAVPDISFQGGVLEVFRPQAVD